MELEKLTSEDVPYYFFIAKDDEGNETARCECISEAIEDFENYFNTTPEVVIGILVNDDGSAINKIVWDQNLHINYDEPDIFMDENGEMVYREIEDENELI